MILTVTAVIFPRPCCAATRTGSRYAVVLDQTVFFPEGGGQPADTGVLGGAHVLDVQLLPDVIVHYTDAPLTPGTLVRGEIDWPQRFRRMQGHSGEHIISGLIHREFGFDNVGFHLGEDVITMDYNGELTWPQLMHIERLANEAVYRNVPIRTEYPAPEQLAHMEYRSKLDLKEDVRIVTVEGYDVCACCAPHVSHTGEIGAIKFTSVMRHRGGVRVTILCGSDAETDYREKSAQVAALSAQLSVRQADVVPAVQRLLDEIAQQKAAAAELERRLNAQRLQLLRETPGSICVIDRFDDPVAMREFVNAGMLLAGGVCAAFTGLRRRGLSLYHRQPHGRSARGGEGHQHRHLRPRRRQADDDPGLMHSPGRRDRGVFRRLSREMMQTGNRAAEFRDPAFLGFCSDYCMPFS